MDTWIAPPVVNQIQVSPFEYRPALIAKSEAAGLVVQGVQPARCRAPPARSDGQPARLGVPPHSPAGTDQVGDPEGPGSDHEVDAAAADRGELRRVRLRPR